MPMDDEATPEQADDRPRPPDDAARGRPKPIDIEQLSERVYRLMLADLRLTRARGAVTARRRD